MKNIITSSGRRVEVYPRIGGRGGKAFNKNYKRRVEVVIKNYECPRIERVGKCP